MSRPRLRADGPNLASDLATVTTGIHAICDALSVVVIGTGYQPIDAGRLPDVLADRLMSIWTGHPLRVAVDGPRAALPFALARSLLEPLRTRGRGAEVIDAETFWRDASLRYEWGRRDLEAYAQRWLDADALQREVLSPLGPGGTSSFLPALRDPATNRSARAAPVTVLPSAIVLISGELLLGRGLPFDYSVHLALDSGARQRLTPPEWQWTLPAHDSYDREVQPTELADIIVRWNDPRHPAIRMVDQAPISPDNQQSMR
jgi:hypothetical protein